MIIKSQGARSSKGCVFQPYAMRGKRTPLFVWQLGNHTATTVVVGMLRVFATFTGCVTLAVELPSGLVPLVD